MGCISTKRALRSGASHDVSNQLSDGGKGQAAINQKQEAEKTKLYEEMKELMEKQQRVLEAALAQREAEKQRERKEMLTQWKASTNRGPMERFEEMLPRIEARWKEQREKQAAIDRKQEMEEAVLEEKIEALEATARTPEQEKEEQIQRKVHTEYADTILRCWMNDVVKFDLDSFDPKDPHNGRIEGQYAGNHFTLAITLLGFIQLLSIIQWDDGKGNVLYKRDETKGGKFWDEMKNACWNTGPLNGYDVCQHVKEYLQKIGKLHQSLLEVIMEGKVEVLKCLRKHVGLADAFFSHVQALPIATMLETLEDAGTRFGKELLHDPVATAALRKQALEELLENSVNSAEGIIGHYNGDWKQIDAWCQKSFASAPALASIAAQKNTGTPKFFIDYCGIRQCLNSDFTLERVVGAIATIGTTVVELDADVLGPDALLKRIFCVMESFATIKAKGVLIVCGPGLRNPVQMLKLAELALDGVACKAVMDSLSAKCRWEEEEIKIKAYIRRTVGFARTDKVVLGAIVRCILGSAESVFAGQADGGAAVLGTIGWLIFETGDHAAALGLLEAALAKEEAAHGPEAAEVADAVYRIGMCWQHIGGTEEQVMDSYERDVRIQAKVHGSEEHASTARSLVGMGRRHGANGDHAKCIECCERALRRIQAAAHPQDYADDYADALTVIGAAHFVKQDWRPCYEWCRWSLEVRAARHGPDHALAAGALGMLARAQEGLGDDPEKALRLKRRALGIEERAQGPLSSGAGHACWNIGNWYCDKEPEEFAEAAIWFRRAVEAFEYTYGPAHPEAKKRRDLLRKGIDQMDPTHPKAKEHQEFLAASEERARLAAQ
jgi:tetratricopeptide (TPR) repeat protein